jgi:hypothetical protein
MEDKPTPGLYEVQWQAGAVSVELIAKDLVFADKVAAFIADTRRSPAHRDIPLADGRFRAVVTELDLSESFLNATVCLGKDGSEDSRYYSRIRSGSLWLRLEIRDLEVDAFLQTLGDVSDW